MLSMDEQNRSKLNLLEQSLPQGLLVDAAWLERKGIPSNLRSYYVKTGWLQQPARGVYRRPGGAMTKALITWQQVVISLQTLLGHPLIVGGMTALDLHGYAHYLTPNPRVIHLYGGVKAPGWLNKLDLSQRFVIRSDITLFRNEPINLGLGSLAVDVETGSVRDLNQFGGGGIETMAWGQWDWPLTLSSPERAYLEFLDELPGNASFHQADMIMQGAVNFRPQRLKKLLNDCKSVKVKRLFFFFADRHSLAWRKHLDPNSIDLGKGKRMLVRGGRLDPVYLITVPEELGADL